MQVRSHLIDYLKSFGFYPFQSQITSDLLNSKYRNDVECDVEQEIVLVFHRLFLTTLHSPFYDQPLHGHSTLIHSQLFLPLSSHSLYVLYHVPVNLFGQRFVKPRRGQAPKTLEELLFF